MYEYLIKHGRGVSATSSVTSVSKSAALQFGVDSAGEGVLDPQTHQVPWGKGATTGRFACIHWGFCLTSWVRQCKLTVKNWRLFSVMHMATTLHPAKTSQLPVPLAPELLLAVHPDRGPIIVDIAPRLAAWTGHSVAELVGQPFDEVFHDLIPG